MAVSGVASFSPKRLRAVHPLDRRVVALFGHEVAGGLGDRPVGVVVDLAAGHDRRPLVEQLDQGADDAGLGLPPLAEEDHVVAGQKGVLQLGKDGVLVAEQPGHDRLAGGHAGHGVGPHLLLDRPGHPAALAQLSDGLRTVGQGIPPIRSVGAEGNSGLRSVPTAAHRVVGEDLDQDEHQAVGVAEAAFPEAPGLVDRRLDVSTPAAARRSNSASTSRTWSQRENLSSDDRAGRAGQLQEPAAEEEDRPGDPLPVDVQPEHVAVEGDRPLVIDRAVQDTALEHFHAVTFSPNDGRGVRTRQLVAGPRS